MAVTKEKKEAMISELAEKLEKSKSFVATSYLGLKMDELAEVRKTLKESGNDFKVIKITLLSRAAKEAGMNDLDISAFEGKPLAVAFGYTDEVNAAKEVFNYAKKNNKLEILGGMLEGRNLTATEVKNLATLPSKEELLARMLGSMTAPVQNFVGVMHANLRSVVYVLNAIKNNKVGE
ncbi:TPA: 50S ribosomal protein L10 [candidate division CPR2 bacterium]|uniref:Large ribosomal subunit protein uL10 n=1 Tax=candidate division CPR2 bacterium GW2011_GWC1_41_48 TaxID=1618344 RepID=A0A0G0Z795_UNCC2|nr:MAG: 50S ribosomal protein L10 [candidate division CPR2 bacterium GW2011_GWC2_39_35]KKR27929.1 MAG: 50S ribosomal protein L10 [candidate division CPR2 bacterium GW2011_GWD2_39_7]KKS08903.1 MAG: LSU ribosomal protein L10p (P0) [candidate division CPR2 bacterium GW2011_GWC1_41_48]OGB72046.1 MAG: 50S ribosomal protein L10 [candidate division CPR2 bacterium GWD2_39_7]HBG81720.1 50S ribosomal protein L10 [candidate division CPR2 bacterium]